MRLRAPATVRGSLPERSSSRVLGCARFQCVPMSTTRSLEVAIKYSVLRSRTDELVLLRLRTSSFLQRGASMAYLSAFPAEEECLYPPVSNSNRSNACRHATGVSAPHAPGALDSLLACAHS